VSGEKLATALAGVDWNGNVAQFTKDSGVTSAVASANMRIALWSKQFETVDHGNPALSFVREMQTAGHHVAVLTALAMYKPAATAMRNMVEAALFYTFFRSHSVELCTLTRDTAYFLTKQDVIEYHKRHTPNFLSYQDKLGLISRLQTWYSAISGIIHGQVPGAWVDHASVKQIKHVAKTQSLAVTNFVDAEDIVYRLFLCTVEPSQWDNFNFEAKKLLLKGLAGDVKALLKLN